MTVDPLMSIFLDLALGAEVTVATLFSFGWLRHKLQSRKLSKFADEAPRTVHTLSIAGQEVNEVVELDFNDSEIGFTVNVVNEPFQRSLASMRNVPVRFDWYEGVIGSLSSRAMPDVNLNSVNRMRYTFSLAKPMSELPS